jgi:hypothetical protein
MSRLNIPEKKDVWDITEEFEEYPCTPVRRWTECENFVEAKFKDGCKYVIWGKRNEEGDIRYCRLGPKLAEERINKNAKYTANCIVDEIVDIEL